MTDEQAMAFAHKWVAENRGILNYAECYGLDIEMDIYRLVKEVAAKVESEQTYGQWISY